MLRRRISKIGSVVAMALGVVAMGATAAQAQTIIWQTSVDLFAGGNNADFVSTNGTLANAINYTDLLDAEFSPTLNGVDFVAANAGGTVTGVTGETITLASTSDNTGAFGDGAFTGNTPIFNLLSTGAFNIASVTLDDLVVGNTYEIQIFSHDARNSRSNAATGFGDGTGSGPVGLLDLNNNDNGVNINDGTGTATGDFIIGTFTATETSIAFGVYGDADITDNGGVPNFATANSQSAINAIQLRTTAVAAEAIPEPSSLALLGLMGLGMAARRRK